MQDNEKPPLFAGVLHRYACAYKPNSVPKHLAVLDGSLFIWAEHYCAAQAALPDKIGTRPCTQVRI